MNGWVWVYTVTTGAFVSGGHTLDDASAAIGSATKKLCWVSPRSDGGVTVVLAPKSIVLRQSLTLIKTGIVGGLGVAINFLAYHIATTLFYRLAF